MIINTFSGSYNLGFSFIVSFKLAISFPESAYTIKMEALGERVNVMSKCFVPGAFTYMIVLNLYGWVYYSHFTDKKTEAHWG